MSAATVGEQRALGFSLAARIERREIRGAIAQLATSSPHFAPLNAGYIAPELYNGW